jgi:diguanylate cyclase
MKWWLRLCSILLCIGPAQALITLDAATVSHPVQSELRFLRDDGAALQFADVQAMPAAAWTQNDAHIFNKGYNSAAWWLRFDVQKRLEVSDRLLLAVSYPVLDEVEVFVLQNGTAVSHFRLGDKQPFQARPLSHRHFLVPLPLQPEQAYTVLLRVRSTSSVQVPLTLWQERAFYDHDQRRMAGQGLYFGAMLVMVLYNLFIFFVVRDRNYLYYVLYAVSFPFFLGSLNGLTFQFLWPEATHWNDQAILVALNSIVFFGIVFTVRFLQLKKQLRWMILPLTGFAVGAVLLASAAFFVGYNHLIRPTIVVATVGSFFVLSAGILCWRKGDSSARFYTIAFSSMLVAGIVLGLNKFQVIPTNLMTENATQLGSAIEVLLLSFALADRINLERRLRFRAQQEALQAQTEVLESQRRANEMLEQRVQERTEALEFANRRLAALSATDQLTGLRNRRFLDEMLTEEVVRCFRYRHSIAFLLLDIDHFKHFNDTYGHLVGDDCLRSVADALRQAVRTQVDRIARYGGEEFCVVLPETDADGARVVAERIRAAVEALEFLVNGRRVPVTVSVGVAAVVPPSAELTQLLILSADKALYEAKAAGRNRVVQADVEVGPAETME